jgi:hypothetical protein
MARRPACPSDVCQPACHPAQPAPAHTVCCDGRARRGVPVPRAGPARPRPGSGVSNPGHEPALSAPNR